ncbi:MAG TPA: hypothetical protein VFU93_13335 [Acidimicrobiales bacterium]|nr:hypothetical protein [Acidimicrobiales bacterium]
MTERDDFVRGIETAVHGTPYVAARTAQGFDLTLDIVDAKWFGLYFKEGLHRVYTHHVEVPNDGTYTVTDDARTVEWQAGVPTISGSVERTRGRVLERSSQKVWALGEDLRPGKVVDYRFSSEEGRQLLRAVADRLGLESRRGGAEKIGLYFAFLGGAGALITVVVLIALALLGKL